MPKYFSELTLEEMFEHHDHTYMMSDDNRAYENGRQERDIMHTKVKEQGGWTKELVDTYNKYAPSGMFQLELGIDIVKSLGYPVNDSPELSERNNIDWDNNVTHVGIDWRLWENDLKRPDYLGTIIGDGGHFTAVVKNIRECDEFGGYAYIDSFTSTQFNCGTIEQMREYIKNKIKPKRVVNVFQKP